jgi:hypothetical protein
MRVGSKLNLKFSSLAIDANWRTRWWISKLYTSAMPEASALPRTPRSSRNDLLTLCCAQRRPPWVFDAPLRAVIGAHATVRVGPRRVRRLRPEVSVVLTNQLHVPFTLVRGNPPVAVLTSPTRDQALGTLLSNARAKALHLPDRQPRLLRHHAAPSPSKGTLLLWAQGTFLSWGHERADRPLAVKLLPPTCAILKPAREWASLQHHAPFTRLEHEPY